ncbi:serine hydrolase domain-containing protein [Paeniglutamicibacter gangotriensis]|uniref:serine hydrolase domain-containing protein n=1 Tax=Paeniglutamicibacter gangotriensis TaxID=254787 RepID=UPI0037C82436
MDDSSLAQALERALPSGSAAACRAGFGSETRIFGSSEPQPVFSVTKKFVAAGVLRAVDAGALRLSDSLASRLPGAPSGCSIAQVLTHTAGLGDYSTNPEYLTAVREHPSDPWSLDSIAAASRQGEPGIFAYSNTGYWYLGAMLEEVSDMGLGQYLHREVFEPADMGSTRYPELETALTASGYSTLWAGPAGAAFSTPEDLLCFESLVTDTDPPSPAAVSPAMRRAFSQSVPVDAPAPWRDPRYGAGVMIDTKLLLWGHGGSGPGHRSAVFTSWDTGAAVAAIVPEESGFIPEEVLVPLLGHWE